MKARESKRQKERDLKAANTVQSPSSSKRVANKKENKTVISDTNPIGTSDDSRIGGVWLECAVGAGTGDSEVSDLHSYSDESEYFDTNVSILCLNM